MRNKGPPITRVAVALAVVLATLTAAGGVATAQTDDGIVGDVFDGEDDVDWSERITGLVSGVLDRITSRGDGKASASAAADALVDEFNQNAGDFQSYVNDRATASTDADVLEVELVVDGETETRYLVADVANDSYENASMVASTDRSVDETCRLTGDAARRAASELDDFQSRFVSENRSVTESYKAHLAGEYGGQVSCTFGDGGE